MRILITGGAGYVGSKLVPALLQDGHRVIVFDTFWFGDYLPAAGGGNDLAKIEGDIRDVDALRATFSRAGVDVVIHLACLSNDPSSEIDKELTKAINLDAFIPLVELARRAGVRRFINCSTSSVYGVSDAPDVREDHPHVPLTLYNTYKSQCEERFSAFFDSMECVTIRPSTICGYAPRQRLDLAVNILTNLAYHKGIITVFGGQQLRPNLHIDDMVDCYRALLNAPVDKIAGETFNVGAGNISIADLAHMVACEVGARISRAVEIETKPINDERSYQVNSEKIAQVLDFVPQRTVQQAIHDLVDAFQGGLLPDAMADSRYYNVKRMKEVHAELYRDAPPSAFRPEDGVLSEIDMRRGARA